MLVVIGVRADGAEELIAVGEGCGESGGSWAGLLRGCVRRGMRAAVLAVGGGAPGFWNGLREVFPETWEQRCRVLETANMLGALPKSAQSAAKKAPAEIWGVEGKEDARAAIRAFGKAYGARFPEAVEKVTDDQDVLPGFYDHPARHRIHLRATNSIKSAFATVRLRTKVTRGAGSRTAALAMAMAMAMAFKLIESARSRRRAANAPDFVALVRPGARFERGILVERHGAAA